MDQINRLAGLFLAQGLVVFVGISVILGRIYFQSYMEALGIPASATSLHVTDYSLIEPNVTLMGIVMALLVPAYAFVLALVPTNRSYSKPWLYVGFATMMSPVFLMSLDIERLEISAPFLVMILCPFGGSLVALGVPLPKARSSKTVASQDQTVFTGLSARTVAVVVALFVFILGFLAAQSYAAAYAKINAERMLTEAPIARIEAEQDVLERLNSATGCDAQEPFNCTFGVILVEDDFIYLHPIKGNAMGIYAMPSDEVRHIHYLPPESLTP